jgi:hydrogenase nickel incorporation protein HypA/HybF
MHELSLAIDLADRALEISNRENAIAIRRLKILIGDQSGVDKEAFRFAFPEVARNTILEKAQLEIQTSPGREFQFLSIEIEDRSDNSPGGPNV